MPQAPPRPTVNGLGGAPPIQRAAQERDFYVRPGEKTLGRPPETNALMQLGESLAKLNPALNAWVGYAAGEDVKNATATATELFEQTKIEHANGNKTWNTLIQEGRIRPGQSPYVEQLIGRMAMRQLGEQYSAEYDMALKTGPEFAQSRASNDPTHLEKDSVAFHAQFMKNNGFGEGATPTLGDPPNKRDVSEVLIPMLDKVRAHGQGTWENMRVEARGKEALDAVGAGMTVALREYSENAQGTAADGGYQARARLTAALADLATEAYNAGLPRTTVNAQLVDAITATMQSTGDTSLRHIVDTIRTNDGKNTLGQIPHVAAKIAAAEEHVATAAHQHLVINEFAANTQHRADSIAFTEEGWAASRKAAIQADLTAKRTNRDDDRHEAVRHYSSNAFQAFTAGKPRELASVFSEMTAAGYGKEAAQIQGDLATLAATQHALASPPSPEKDLLTAKEQTRIEINARSYPEGRLIQLLSTHQIGKPEFDKLFSLLSSKKSQPEHPFLSGAYYTSVLATVTHAVGGNPYDKSDRLGQIALPKALAETNAIARAYADTHPGAKQSEFEAYMAEQTPKIVMRHSKEVAEQVQSQHDEEARSADVAKAATDLSAKDAKARWEHSEQFKQIQKQSAEINAKDNTERTSEGRKIIRLPDGSIETEKTITFQDRHNENRWVNFPTIFGGEHVTPAQAVRIYEDNGGVDPDTGKRAKVYYDEASAEIAARERSAQLGKLYGGPQKEPAPPEKGNLPTPSSRSIAALKKDYTQENFDAFVKMYGYIGLHRAGIGAPPPSTHTTP